MPPHGLYPIPRQHLYGNPAQRPRPVFNTMNFKNEGPAPANKVIEEAAQVVNGLAKDERKDKDKSKKEQKKKEKKRESMGEKETGESKGIPRTSGRCMMPTSTSKTKKKEKDGDEARSSAKKKRKRESEVNAGSALLNGTEMKSEYVEAEPAWLQNVKSLMGDVRTNLDQQAGSEEPKKVKAKKRNSAAADGVDMTHAQLDGAVKQVKPTVASEVPPAKKQKSKKDKTRESPAAQPPAVVSKIQITSSPYALTPKKTPVPLPKKSASHATSTKASALKRHALAGRSESEVLVTETPPSQIPHETPNGWKTPIPFDLSVKTGTVKKPKTVSGNFVTSTFVPPPSSAPAALSKTSSQNALTSSNLLRYTAPLNDSPKPRPRARESSVSSASSMSIKDAFARLGKPSPSASIELNPFFTPQAKKKINPETHAEASAPIFAKSFLAAQLTVNFTGERECLTDHLAFRARNDAAGPLPCLKSATGCNAKSEQVLRLMKDEPSSLLKFTVCTESEQTAFDTAVAAVYEAERFLRNAIAARVPVSLGKLDGVYTLYCPKYASAHVDKYGFGQRTLSISRPSGFKSSSTYTARLTIPPSPVACTLLAFTPPPHASFRVTTLTTSAEGYTMGLVCLGYGYVLLRVDMGLLITGKKTEMGSGGDVCMEFLGVKERDGKGGGGAVVWPVEEKGEEKERVVVVEESPMKKKRGRPSNAELERRAREREERERGGE